MGAALRVIIGIVLCVTLIFIPTGIALMRRHNNFVPILLVNLLLGLTGIGWIVALVWSFTNNVAEKRTVVELITALKDGKLES